MCGIFGAFWGRRPPLERGCADAMARALRNRGPDGSDIYFGTHGFVGLTRRAVFSSSTTARLGHSRDGTWTVATNGEVYNHIALSKRFAVEPTVDVDVLPDIVAAGERDLPSLLDGPFATAAFNDQKGQLILSRDDWGQRPLYVAVTDEAVFFASSVKAILATGKVPFALDVTRCAEILMNGCFDDDGAIVEKIIPLPPGSVLVDDVSAPMRLTPRSVRPPRPKSTQSIDLVTAVKTAVEKRVNHGESPAALLFSGGLDSSLVAALCPDSTKQAFFIDTGNRQERCLVEERARELGLELDIVDATVVDKQTEDEALAVFEAPDAYFAFGTLASQYLLAKRVAERGFRVVMGGEGADELFLGYPWHRFWLARCRRQMEPLYPAWFASFDRMDMALARRILSDDILPRRHEWLLASDAQLRPAVRASFEELLNENIRHALNEISTTSTLTRAAQTAPELQFEALNEMCSWPLRVADRIFAHFGVEVRCPFLDKDVVAAARAAALSDAEFYDDGERFADKAYLRRTFSMISSVATAPPKKGFGARRHRQTKAELTSWNTDPFALNANPQIADKKDLGAQEALHRALVLETCAQGLYQAVPRSAALRRPVTGKPLAIIAAPARWCRRCLLTDARPLSLLLRQAPASVVAPLRIGEDGVCSLCTLFEQQFDADAHRLDTAKLFPESPRADGKLHAVVALSGGKDSLSSLYRVTKGLGLSVLAVLIDNGFIPDPVIAQAQQVCDSLDVTLQIVAMTDADRSSLHEAAISANSPIPCSLCSKVILSSLKSVAVENDVDLILTGTSYWAQWASRPLAYSTFEHEGRRLTRVHVPFALGLTATDVHDDLKTMGAIKYDLPGLSSNCLIPSMMVPRRQSSGTRTQHTFVEDLSLDVIAGHVTRAQAMASAVSAGVSAEDLPPVQG